MSSRPLLSPLRKGLSALRGSWLSGPNSPLARLTPAARAAALPSHLSLFIEQGLTLVRRLPAVGVSAPAALSSLEGPLRSPRKTRRRARGIPSPVSPSWPSQPAMSREAPQGISSRQSRSHRRGPGARHLLVFREAPPPVSPWRPWRLHPLPTCLLLSSRDSLSLTPLRPSFGVPGPAALSSPEGPLLAPR